MVGRERTQPDAALPALAQRLEELFPGERSKQEAWLDKVSHIKTKSRLISATGTYSWTYKPLRKGAYRMRAQIAQTATHTAAKTVWRKFKVT